MTPFPGRVSVPNSFVSLFTLYILSYHLSKTMGCFSGCLMSSAGDQKLFCEAFSAFKCSFDKFVGEKVVSPSYSCTILAPPTHSSILAWRIPMDRGAWRGLWGHKKSDMIEILITAQHTIHDLLNMQMWNTDPEGLQIRRNYGYKWSDINYMWTLDCLEDWCPQSTHCSRVNCTLTIIDQPLYKAGLAKNNHRAFTSPSSHDGCCSTQSKPHGLSCGCRTHLRRHQTTSSHSLAIRPIHRTLCVSNVHSSTYADLANLPEILSWRIWFGVVTMWKQNDALTRNAQHLNHLIHSSCSWQLADQIHRLHDQSQNNATLTTLWEQN